MADLPLCVNIGDLIVATCQPLKCHTPYVLTSTP
jgi:hypothetical protein